MAEDEYKLIFSRNLRYYMNLRNKNQMDLMRDLNLSSSTVSNWCTGLKLPRMDKVQLLADYLGILKSDLIEDKAPSSTPADAPAPYYLNDETRQIAQEVFENPELRSLFDAARDLPPERLRAHIDFINSLKAQEKGNNEGSTH